MAEKAKKAVSKTSGASKSVANTNASPVVSEAVVSKTTSGVVSKDVLTSASKQDIINLFATKEGDTGSPEVQIAVATQKIYLLSSHLEQNPKDNHSRRGLLKIIAKRRRIIQYLAKKDKDRYSALIIKLELKK